MREERREKREERREKRKGETRTRCREEGGSSDVREGGRKGFLEAGKVDEIRGSGFGLSLSLSLTLTLSHDG